MEKSKKIILVDDEDKIKVAQAIVIHKGVDGRYLLSSHPKTEDMHWEGTSGYDVDGGYVSDGYSLKQGNLYSLSKIQAYTLSNKKPDSWLFKSILNRVLTNNEIHSHKLTGEALKNYEKIAKDDFELVKPEVEKREAYLHDKIKQKKEAERIANKKSKEVYSKKVFDYIKKFQEK